MEVEKIYFDMDGVLADFNRGVVELCHRPVLKQGEGGPTADDELWDAVRAVEHFYDELHPIAGAVEMFRTLYEKYGDKCEILTAVPKPHRNIPNAGEDKISWVRRLLSEDVVINIVYRAEKQEFVKNRNCILIDDYQINIDEWEAAGGTGILFETAEGVLAKIERLVES